MDGGSVWLTVYFEDPFWVGVLQRSAEGRMEAARIVFGAEPKDYDVYALVLSQYERLRFSPAVAVERSAVEGGNPKRRQREASQLLSQTGAGTKAQQALALQREAGKRAQDKRARELAQAMEEKRFALRQAKRKQKHRGH